MTGPSIAELRAVTEPTEVIGRRSDRARSDLEASRGLTLATVAVAGLVAAAHFLTVLASDRMR